MARNEEKHYGRLNRLYLLKEKEEFEKAHPKRPRLDVLNTPEEIQEWLPSIKQDIDFYLKKSQVTCYSDAHVEDCREKVNKLEKEFKAFVRKIKQLTNCPGEAIPWTSRPYKRKSSETFEESTGKEFKRITTPILDKETKIDQNAVTSLYNEVNSNLMNEPLSFNFKSRNDELDVSEHSSKEEETNSYISVNCFHTLNNRNSACRDTDVRHTFTSDMTNELKTSTNFTTINNTELNKIVNIVNYDSSDSETS